MGCTSVLVSFPYHDKNTTVRLALVFKTRLVFFFSALPLVVIVKVSMLRTAWQRVNGITRNKYDRNQSHHQTGCQGIPQCRPRTLPLSLAKDHSEFCLSKVSLLSNTFTMRTTLLTCELLGAWKITAKP